VSTEQRDVRPFASIPELDDLFKSAVLRYGIVEIESGGRAILDEDAFVRAPVELVLATNVGSLAASLERSHDALAELDLSLDDVSFVVAISSSYLKSVEFRSQVAMSAVVDVGTAITLSSEPRPAPFLSPRSGCTVEVLAYLSSPRSKAPLRPWRFGTWLARGVFEVVTEQHFTGFTPKPLTTQKKGEFKLSPKAMRYITLAASPLEEGITEDSVEVWFDADLLAKASAISTGKASMAMQRQLFVDAVSAVVHAAKAEPELAGAGWADVRNTLLGRVVLAVAPTSGNEDVRNAACTSYLEMIKTDPAQFLSFAEEAAGLVAAFDSALEG